MTDPQPDAGSLVALRMSHLGMIESTISRLSGHSATVKNFSITALVGLLALAASLKQREPLLGAIAVPIFFAALDAYYLSVERAFRHFYRTVAERPLVEAPSVTMDQPKAQLWGAFRSPVVWLFYVPQALLAAGIWGCWHD